MKPFKRSKAASPNGSNGRLCVLTVWLVASAIVSAAQTGVDLRLAVNAGARVQTQTFSLSPLEELSIELVDLTSQREPIISIYIYDEQGLLVGRDDPESVSDRFTWQPPIAGKYYAVVDNTGPGGGIVRVRTITGTRAVHSAGRSLASEFATVRVLFATDRQDGGNSSQPVFGSTPAAELSYGYGDVSIPRDHRLGELEGPSILRLEFRADPSRHIVLLNVRSQSEQAFREQLSTRLTTSRRKEVLLFVHGFNVTFDDAMRRTAQVAYDLAFDGPAIAFSWPSQGSPSPLAYTRDQRNADLSATSLRKVLELLTSAGDITVHVIAHSMGNRILVSALQQLAPPSATRQGALREVAFLAPDVDAELFKRSVKQIAGKATRMTLYASSRDGALEVAQRVAGYQRAGQAGAQIVVVPEIQTIDASEVDTSLLGLNHSYFADNSTIVSDLFTLLKGQGPQERFGLVPIVTAAGTYWRFRPAIR
jgi:esterase/lipase superfamily enzyme